MRRRHGAGASRWIGPVVNLAVSISVEHRLAARSPPRSEAGGITTRGRPDCNSAQMIVRRRCARRSAVVEKPREAGQRFRHCSRWALARIAFGATAGRRAVLHAFQCGGVQAGLDRCCRTADADIRSRRVDLAIEGKRSRRCGGPPRLQCTCPSYGRTKNLRRPCAPHAASQSAGDFASPRTNAEPGIGSACRMRTSWSAPASDALAAVSRVVEKHGGRLDRCRRRGGRVSRSRSTGPPGQGMFFGQERTVVSSRIRSAARNEGGSARRSGASVALHAPPSRPG